MDYKFTAAWVLNSWMPFEELWQFWLITKRQSMSDMHVANPRPWTWGKHHSSLWRSHAEFDLVTFLEWLKVPASVLYTGLFFFFFFRGSAMEMKSSLSPKYYSVDWSYTSRLSALNTICKQCSSISPYLIKTQSNTTAVSTVINDVEEAEPRLDAILYQTSTTLGSAFTQRAHQSYIIKLVTSV